MNRAIIVGVLFLLMAGEAMGQKQLVLIKNERILLRLVPGDDIVYKIKGNERVYHTYVNNLSDTALVTHNDTVPYHTIERVYFKKGSFASTVGVLLVAGGAGYFLIDQINNVLVNGNDPTIDKQIATASAIMVGVGLPMILIHRNYQKIGGRRRLLMVTPGSGFYLPDRRGRGYISPEIPY